MKTERTIDEPVVFPKNWEPGQPVRGRDEVGYSSEFSNEYRMWVKWSRAKIAGMSSSDIDRILGNYVAIRANKREVAVEPPYSGARLKRDLSTEVIADMVARQRG